MTLEAASAWRAAQLGSVVFTNGVFDILHPGHVELLVRARQAGDSLLVAVNSDASVRRLKGPGRPVRSAAERAFMVAALEAVDAVTVFEEDTPATLIRVLQPDVLVKGGDYTIDTVVGAADVLARGGEVIIVPLLPGYSTTGLISMLREGNRAED
jgi:D-beta-D-heptose 7-phosphate kinase/D-beta-D-heptose 1-phosphate adenosyltransferase